MKKEEYNFSEYKEQLENIKGELLKGDDSAYQSLIAFDNTITGLESTRYPGNAALLEFQKEARELLAQDIKKE